MLFQLSLERRVSQQKLYLHLPGKGRLERDVNFNWTSKKVDKVARQSEREGKIKNPQDGVQDTQDSQHRKKGADHLCRFFTSCIFIGFIIVFQFNLHSIKLARYGCLILSFCGQHWLSKY